MPSSLPTNQVVDSLAGPDKHHLRARGSRRGKRAAAFCSAVQLCKDNASHRGGLVERLCLLERPLPDGAVDYKKYKVRRRHLVHVRHFLQQALFFLVPSGGVYDDDVKVLLCKMRKAVSGNGDCVLVLLVAIDFDVYLAAVHL
jgi:hypothetical protein